MESIPHQAPPSGGGGTGIHPLALGVGIVGLLLLVVIVSASSYQRERLQYMARKLVRRRKRPSFSEDSKRDGDIATGTGSLPGFVRTAAETGNARVIKRWVNSSKKEIDARSNENFTALHYTARSGHNECTRLLLAAGADPNVLDESRLTPLHLAALGGHALCVKLLLDHHADPFREDVDRHTPLVIAEQSDNIGCARLLQRAMAKATVQEQENAVSPANAAANLTLRGATRIENAV